MKNFDGFDGGTRSFFSYRGEPKNIQNKLEIGFANFAEQEGIYPMFWRKKEMNKQLNLLFELF